MNNIEKIEEAIEAKMAEIETYEGIKRLNSYVVFAQFLEYYVEECLIKANDRKALDTIKKDIDNILKGKRQ